MELVRLTADFEITEFDCGDEDLNNFLVEDAKAFLDKRIANSFILLDEGRIVAYFCLLNDKISKEELTNNQWKKLRSRFPDGKRFTSYPAIKVGRFAVSKLYRGQNMGSYLMDLVKDMLDTDHNFSAFRFITVDAYLSATGFYEKNGFVKLSPKAVNPHTTLMFFDLLNLN